MTVMTVKEVAHLLKVTPATVYMLCAQGQLAHVRIGVCGRGAIRVREEDLATFLASAVARMEGADPGNPPKGN